MAHNPRIIESVNVLSSHRPSIVKDLVHSVAARGRRVEVSQRSIGSRYWVVGVSDINERSHNYRNWRFRTYLSDFSAMYYERWISHGREYYFLERVYFHLYKVDKENLEEQEYILLHCDASEPTGSRHSPYKTSPHIHVSKAENPLPHAHIALNNGNLKEVLTSLDSLTLAIDQAVKMIDDQVLLPRIDS